MKKLTFFLLAVLGIMLYSCLDDDDDNGNNYWIGIGTIVGSENNFVIELDEEDSIKPVLNPIAWLESPKWGDDIYSGSRILINFSIFEKEFNKDGSVKQYQVRINDFQRILKKDIVTLTAANADSIGNDPIIVLDHWVTDSLLNLKLKFWGNDKTHFLNLGQQENTQETPINLELRHNAYDDQQSVLYTTYVSFCLNKLRKTSIDSVKFKVSSTDYNGTSHTFEEVFHYDTNEK